MRLQPTLKTDPRDLALQTEVDQLLLLAANGSEVAHEWLRFFYLWSHALDDFVDEPGRPRAEVIGLCINAVVLGSHPFFTAHTRTLAPLLGVVAAQYEASLNLDLPVTLRQGLRLAGNQVILTVALLTGGAALVEQINGKLWPGLVKSQLSE